MSRAVVPSRNKNGSLVLDPSSEVVGADQFTCVFKIEFEESNGTAGGNEASHVSSSYARKTAGAWGRVRLSLLVV
jgi:hypothetical protein